MRTFARRLIAYESRADRISEARTSHITFPACARLRPHLTTLVGHAGYRALLMRALALAGAEVSWLRAVQVKGDGSLAAPAEVRTRVDPKKILEGRIILLAQLLGLLVAFIGRNLTLRLVSEIWPKVKLDDRHYGGDGKNETTK